MRFDLQPITDPGRRFVALAESHIPTLVERAEIHDKEGTFPLENIADFQASGLLAACIPVELGGLGVASIHDVIVALNRLGRGDGSTAIATNMHTAYAFLMARRWNSAVSIGDTARADRLAVLLTAATRGEAVFCALNTEPGTDLLHPRCAATTTEGGWRLNGRKSFGTLTPAATHGGVTFHLIDDQGIAQIATAMIPLTRDGLAVQHNWDALGMRASGSHDVVLTDVFVADGEMNLFAPYGEYAEGPLISFMIASSGLLGAFLGIAEAAFDHILGLVATRRTAAGRPQAESFAVQYTVAEMEIDLAACRAMLARTAMATDTFLATHTAGAASLGELHARNKDFQCTKWMVNRKAIEIVDRALQLSGGSGYLSRSVLSRLYRDVRAGPFMQPYSPNEAFQYIGKVALGLDPRLE